MSVAYSILPFILLNRLYSIVALQLVNQPTPVVELTKVEEKAAGIPTRGVHSIALHGSMGFEEF